MSLRLMEDMKLDVADLDRAALDQPSIFAYWGEEWAKTVFERDKVKEQISSKRAEIDEKIRTNPEKYGWGNLDKKPTENWVSAQIDSSTEIIELMETLSQAQYDVSMMSVAKEACEHRLKALSILTELYKGNYFSAASRGTPAHTITIEHSREKQSEKLSEHPRMKKLLKKRE